jgi:hypothetical protein
MRRIGLCLAFVLCAVALAGCPRVVVLFPDDVLEAAVRAAIEKPTGDILDTDLIDLTSLSVGGGVADLTGMEYCIDLESFTVAYPGTITDLDPISGLTSLTLLVIAGSSISDVSPLVGLTNLVTLGLEYNAIVNIGPLASLVNVATLTLTGNQIADISALSSMADMYYLYLDDNEIDDLTPLADMSDLTQLYLQGNATLSGLTGLETTENLYYLNLSGCSIVDISALVDNAGFGAGDTIDLLESILSAQAMLDIATLQGRGVTVNYSPPTGFHWVSYSADEGGSIVGESWQVVADGGNGTPVVATPNRGHKFAGWSDDPA